ncbi:MAG: hypothetical protein V4591_02375 [Bdellovibrionota bacterium]
MKFKVAANPVRVKSPLNKVENDSKKRKLEEKETPKDDSFQYGFPTQERERSNSLETTHSENESYFRSANTPIEQLTQRIPLADSEPSSLNQQQGNSEKKSAFSVVKKTQTAEGVEALSNSLRMLRLGGVK